MKINKKICLVNRIKSNEKYIKKKGNFTPLK